MRAEYVENITPLDTFPFVGQLILAYLNLKGKKNKYHLRINTIFIKIIIPY